MTTTEQQQTQPPARPVDAVELFAQLVREVDAGRALVCMTPLGERHRAAVDALALARDVLADARDLLGTCACGGTQLVTEELGDLHGRDGIAHSWAACVSIDAVIDAQMGEL